MELETGVHSSGPEEKMINCLRARTSHDSFTGVKVKEQLALDVNGFSGKGNNIMQEERHLDVK